MTYKETIPHLESLMSTLYYDEDKEALNIAITTIKEISNNITKPLIFCPHCYKIFRKKIEKSSYDGEYDFEDCERKCPYCGKTYEWTDCYWR